GTFIGGNAVRFAAERVREKILEIASKEMEIDPGDLEIADGEVTAKGAPDRKLGLADVAAAATWSYGELITGTGAAFKKYATVDDDTGEVDNAPQPAIMSAIHDAVGVWVTEAPATPHKVLTALQERREPRREGKRVVYDEELSIRAVSASAGKGADGTGFLLPDE